MLARILKKLKIIDLELETTNKLLEVNVYPDSNLDFKKLKKPFSMCNKNNSSDQNEISLIGTLVSGTFGIIIGILASFGVYSLIKIEKKKKLIEELVIEDLEIGSGEEVKKGDFLLVHYSGFLTDGTQFDSSYDRGQPFVIQIGVGQVIPGWDEGMIGIKEGGVRKLSIPAKLAYGEEMMPGIPANSDLVFIIEVIEILDLK